MSRILIVLIAALCSICLLLNQAYAAGLHACCRAHQVVKQVATHTQAEGDCHFGEAQQSYPPKNSKTQSSDCHCHPASPPAADSKIKALTSPSDTPVVVTVLPPSPTQSLQVVDAETPIWLYRLFCPDRSKSYLVNRRLLL